MSEPRRKQGRGPANPRSAPPSASSRRSSSAGRPSNRAAASSRSRRPSHGTSSYPNQAQLWTKDPKGRGRAHTSHAPASGIKAVFGAVGRFFSYLLTMIARSRIAVVLCAVLLVAGVAAAVDFGLNWGKVYQGVTIGEVDAGGKSVEEVRTLVEETYAGRLVGKDVIVCANDEISQDVESAIAEAQNNELADQISFEEAQANKTVWLTDAESLRASLDIDALVDRAVRIGREDGGLFARIGAFLFGAPVEPEAAFDPEALEALAHDIDLTIGTERVNYNIKLIDGTAWVTDGHEGDMIDRGEFAREISSSFLKDDSSRAVIVARTAHAPIQIERAEAQRVCDIVNASIAQGADFVYGDTTWTASPSDIGPWIKTRVDETDGGYRLQPYLDEGSAKAIVLNHLQTEFDGDALHVRFEIVDGEPIVNVDTKETIPMAAEAVRSLDSALFGSSDAQTSKPAVSVGDKQVPGTMSFDDALENGIIGKVASFTTDYTVEPVARQHNIHLVSDLLNNSIIEANGGSWSFNGTAGNCNEEAGFQGAGAIIDGEFVDAVGGGICQVATTVFNAVYDAGFPVTTRWNHSLYIASYPAGRDAAVSWPDLDLVWNNDSASDVILVMGYTDTSVTATLYGVDPEYQVSTTSGEWEKGETFKTKTETDDTMAAGTSYVKTSGTDGRKITIVRTVTDKNGTILHEDVFSSQYDPKDEVIVQGPKKDDTAQQPDQA